MLQSLTNWLSRTKNIFLVDGLGALLTALFLGLVLPYWNNHIGMPVDILYMLSAIALLFAIYSLTCYFAGLKNRSPYLQFIAICNLIYCLLSLGLVIYFHAQIKPLGWIYFLLEILIIVSLAVVELRIVKETRHDTI